MKQLSKCNGGQQYIVISSYQLFESNPCYPSASVIWHVSEGDHLLKPDVQVNLAISNTVNYVWLVMMQHCT